ncbi:hypothetical protein SNK03_011496 [Fusarium graminearum]
MYLKVTDKDKNPSVHTSSTGMTDWCETWVPSLGSPKQIGTPSHPLAVRADGGVISTDGHICSEGPNLTNSGHVLHYIFCQLGPKIKSWHQQPDAVVFSLSGDNDPEIHYHAGQDS